MELGSVLFGSPFKFNVSIDGGLGLRIRPTTGRNPNLEARVSGSLPADALAGLTKVAGAGSLSSPFSAVGKSGVKHTFTFGTREGGSTRVVCDIVSGTAPVDETKVLSLFIKVYDVGATQAILCATPSLSDGAKKLAGIYKITVIEAPDRGSAVKKVTEALGRINKRT